MAIQLKTNYKAIAVLIVLLVTFLAIASVVVLYTPAPITGFVAGVANLTVTCDTSLTLTNATVFLGIMAAAGYNDTLDGSPTPFVVQNAGNTDVNVTIRATSLFKEAPNPTDFFKFMCGNYSDGTKWAGCECKNDKRDCGGEGQANGSMLNFSRIPLNTSTAYLALWNLSYRTNNNTLSVHINVTVPSNTSGGLKTSSVTFEAVSNLIC